MRPLAVVLLTAAFGGVLGFIGLRQLRRRRRPDYHRQSSVSGSGESIPDETERDESESFPVCHQRATNLRRFRQPQNVPLLRILFEFLILVISMLLAWVVSPAEPSFLVLLHMGMIWLSLQSVGVSLPSVSELEDDDPHSKDPNRGAALALPSSEDKPDIDGNSASQDPALFLGRPPSMTSDSYQWIGPFNRTFEFDICSAVHHYWTFFGSESMPKLTADLLDSKMSLSGEQLVHRAVRLLLNPPYFIKSALGGVSDVEIRERSIWNPKEFTFRAHSCNISSRSYVTVMDICEIRRDSSNPDWTCMTRRVCFQVSESVGMLRSSLQTFIRTMIRKKADEFFVKFQCHLENGTLCSDPSSVMSRVGNAPSA